MRRYLYINLIFFISYCFGAENYFLCGTDEDGCLPDNYRYCLCIPRDDYSAEQPYCLDFDKIACIPLGKFPNCPSGAIFKNQSECLATAFQSEPDPPCAITNKSFCQEHHVPFLRKSTVY